MAYTVRINEIGSGKEITMYKCATLDDAIKRARIVSSANVSATIWKW